MRPPDRDVSMGVTPPVFSGISRFSEDLHVIVKRPVAVAWLRVVADDQLSCHARAGYGRRGNLELRNLAWE